MSTPKHDAAMLESVPSLSSGRNVMSFRDYLRGPVEHEDRYVGDYDPDTRDDLFASIGEIPINPEAVKTGKQIPGENFEFLTSFYVGVKDCPDDAWNKVLSKIPKEAQRKLRLPDLASYTPDSRQTFKERTLKLSPSPRLPLINMDFTRLCRICYVPRESKSHWTDLFRWQYDWRYNESGVWLMMLDAPLSNDLLVFCNESRSKATAGDSLKFPRKHWQCIFQRVGPKVVSSAKPRAKSSDGSEAGSTATPTAIKTTNSGGEGTSPSTTASSNPTPGGAETVTHDAQKPSLLLSIRRRLIRAEAQVRLLMPDL